MTHEPNDHPSASAEVLGDTLRWAFELEGDPMLAGAQWMTREIVPGAKDPFDAIAAPTTSLDALRELKSAYKLLRTNGATAAERSLAARLYAATIAAAYVRYRTPISSQNGSTLVRAFGELVADDSMPERIRELASLAIDFAKSER